MRMVVMPMIPVPVIIMPMIIMPVASMTMVIMPGMAAQSRRCRPEHAQQNAKHHKHRQANQHGTGH